MEGFGNSSLYCNFNPPEKKRSYSKRTPKKSSKSPKSPKTPQTYVSPDPTVKSPVFDQNLIDHETDLNLREEEFLIELKLFYEGIDKYNQLKAEYEEMLRNKETGRFSLIEFASRLSMYQDMLEQRFDSAQKVLSEPVDDLEAEERLVQQLEQEVIDLKNGLPQEVPPEAQLTIDQMMKELEQINADNQLNQSTLRRRKAIIDSKRNKLIKEQIDVESMENEEKRFNEQLKRDQDKLSKTPKIDEEQAIRDEKLRAELEQRKKENQQKQIDFENKCRSTEESLYKLQTEVRNLQAEQSELSKLKDETDRMMNELKSLIEGKENFETNVANADDEISKLKRKLETQLGDLEKMNEKMAKLQKRDSEAQYLKSQLLLRDEELKKRRAGIESSDEQFAQSRAEIEAMKKYLSELDEEVKKQEKLSKDMMANVLKVQEELDLKSNEIQQSQSASHIEELQNLLNASETGAS